LLNFTFPAIHDGLGLWCCQILAAEHSGILETLVKFEACN